MLFLLFTWLPHSPTLILIFYYSLIPVRISLNYTDICLLFIQQSGLFAMIIIIYFYLFVCIEYLLLLNMIIMLLLYLIMINIFIIHFHFNIVVMMLLLLYCFLNCILIIKIDNSFTIFFYGGFLLIFIIIIFMNWFILNMINFYLSIMRYFIQEVHLRTCLISKILFVNSSNLFLCFISSGRVVTPSKSNYYAIITQLLCHLPKSRL